MTDEVKSHYLNLGGLAKFYQNLLANKIDGIEGDIANLQSAYRGITQSSAVVGTLPASGVVDTIYRVPGTVSYSDYMWDGEDFVLMATYNNAIDSVPTQNSENLVTSGGVKTAIDGCLKPITQSQFDNIFEL